MVHCQVARLFRDAGIGWCEIEWLPGYAPELDPVEMVWSHTK
jgi:transposase